MSRLPYVQALTERKETRHLPSNQPDVVAWMRFFKERIVTITSAQEKPPGTIVPVDVAIVDDPHITKEFLKETFSKLVLVSEQIPVVWVTHKGEVLTKEQFVDRYELQNVDTGDIKSLTKTLPEEIEKNLKDY